MLPKDVLHAFCTAMLARGLRDPIRRADLLGVVTVAADVLAPQFATVRPLWIFGREVAAVATNLGHTEPGGVRDEGTRWPVDVSVEEGPTGGTKTTMIVAASWLAAPRGPRPRPTVGHTNKALRDFERLLAHAAPVRLLVAQAAESEIESLRDSLAELVGMRHGDLHPSDRVYALLLPTRRRYRWIAQCVGWETAAGGRSDLPLAVWP